MSFTLYHIVFRLDGYEDSITESIAYMFLNEKSAKNTFSEIKKYEYDGVLQEALLYKVSIGLDGRVYRTEVIDSKIITQDDLVLDDID